jgi:hypothetical protein
MQGIPGAVLVGAFALLTDEFHTDFARVSPIPAHSGQVVTTGRLEADGTIFAFGKAALSYAPLK